MQDYITVKKGAYDEFVEKKSRFIGYCKPLKSEEEAIDFINAVRAKHRDATHNVYAYIVRDNNIMRYSDDSEPAGTAGMPVLDVLRSNSLTDVGVVVTRYFGGTLLGTGGLVRAYTKGAKIAVEAAQITQKIFCGIYEIECDYSMFGKLRYAVEENEKYIIKDIIYTDAVKIITGVPEGERAAFEKMIADKSQGVVVPKRVSEEYVDKSL